MNRIRYAAGQRRFALLIVPTLAASVSIQAQDWVAIPAEQPNVIFSVDLASIERKGNRVKFQEKLTFEQPTVTDSASGKPIKEKRVRRIMDCKDKTQGVLSGSMISDTGSLIEMVSYEKLEMKPIPAGTLAEEEHRLVCGWTGEGNSTKPPQR
jgi:hypothetical protein